MCQFWLPYQRIAPITVHGDSTPSHSHCQNPSLPSATLFVAFKKWLSPYHARHDKVLYYCGLLLVFSWSWANLHIAAGHLHTPLGKKIILPFERNFAVFHRGKMMKFHSLPWSRREHSLWRHNWLAGCPFPIPENRFALTKVSPWCICKTRNMNVWQSWNLSQQGGSGKGNTVCQSKKNLIERGLWEEKPETQRSVVLKSSVRLISICNGWRGKKNPSSFLLEHLYPLLGKLRKA